MPSAFGTSLLILAALLFGALGAIFILLGVTALLRVRPLRFAVRTLAGLLFLTAGALFGAINIGIQGYRALTREDVAARIEVRPTRPQRFEATFHIADRPPVAYEIAGDEIYVDAHILKWSPVANVLGLHSDYELDRVTGRYHDLPGAVGAADGVFTRRGQGGGSVRSSPALRVSRVAVRCRVRLGIFCPGQETGGVRSSRLHHGFTHPRGQAGASIVVLDRR